MAPLLEVGFLGVFLLVGTGLLGLGVRSAWTGYRIRGRAADGVMDAVAGEPVDLEGAARPHEETLSAPFSRRDCLGYKYEIEEYRHDDDGSDWRTVEEGTDVVPFLLDLESGSVLVDAAAGDPDVDLNDDQERWTVSGGSAPPERIERFIAENESVGSENRSLDLGVAELDYGSRRRYTESALVPGETTYVSGVSRGGRGVSGRLPRSASAAVGPPETNGGAVARVARALDPLTFYVADAPKDEAARRQFVRSVFLVLVGLVFVAVPSFMLFSLLAT